MKACDHVRQYWCGKELPCADYRCEATIQGVELHMEVIVPGQAPFDLTVATFTRTECETYWEWSLR